MTREYDVYLDGDGYMLARRGDGQLLGGAAKSQGVDPFSRFVSGERRWAKARFQFGEGAGLNEYDGSYRYKDGRYIDTRGGRVIMGPERTLAESRGAMEEVLRGNTLAFGLGDVEISTGNNVGYAERFQAPADGAIVNVAVLVKRDPDTDYSGAAAMGVGIAADAAGPKPGVAIQSANVSIVAEPDPWLPFADRWRNGEYFWLEATFATGAVVVSGTYYWIFITNSQAPEVYWADSGFGASVTRSHYTAGAWVNGYSDDFFLYKMKYEGGEIDGFVRCFGVFRGTDGVERMFAGVDKKVMYYDESTGDWGDSNIFAGATARVVQLLEFNDRLFAAREDGVNMYYYDGTTYNTVWTDAGVHGQALAIHDNMLWKADGRDVMASTTGLAASWTANAVSVGDPGTPVQSMISHGGKLYAAKPEGIFELDYPSTYPTSGTPTANLLLDFRTERVGRGWLVDWHSGLYFPGLAGVYEFKSGVLRDIWTEKVDAEAQELQGAAEVYTRPRRFAPFYDALAGTWLGCHANTRGLVFAYSSPHLDSVEVWWYDGRYWHPLGPLYISVKGWEELAEYCMAVYLWDRGGGRGTLFCGYGMNIVQMQVPTWTADRLLDDDADFWDFDAGQCDLPDFVLDERETEVDYYAVGLELKNAGAAAGGTVSVRYRIDGAAAWTLLGEFDAAYEEIAFGADTRGRRIELRLVVVPDNDNDVAVESLVLLYQPLPETVQTFQLMLTVADDVEKKNGSPDKTRTAADLATALEALLEEDEPWTYQDVRGVDHTVRAMGVTVQEMRLIEKPGPLGYRYESQALVTLLGV